MSSESLTMVVSIVVAVLAGTLAALQRLGVLSVAHRKPRTDPPPAVTVAARTAGFDPGDTGRFQALSSLGQMRCDAHQAITGEQTAILAELRDMRRESRDAFEVMTEKLDVLLMWRGAIEARLTAVEREVERLRNRGA